MSLSEQEKETKDKNIKSHFFISEFFLNYKIRPNINSKNYHTGIPNSMVKTLTITETILLEKNPELLKAPKNILEELAKGRQIKIESST